ncbi:MAG: ABC transporter permease [Halanaerobiales bacterium]|nr:ABC transporter permease [Halanaerobiales bacterium]
MNYKNQFKRILRISIKPIFAFTGALLVGTIIFLLTNVNPITAFSAMFGASFKNLSSFSQALVQTSPLLFTGIAVAFAFQASVYNIGAEGQFLAGAIMATWAGVSFYNLPSIIMIPIVILAGAIGGGIWGFIPGYLKAKYNVSEIITTIMFNFIAIRLIGYLVKGPLKTPEKNVPQSAKIAKTAILPTIMEGSHLHIGFILGLIIAVALFIIIFKTYFGYEIRAIGSNPKAAALNGIKVNKTMVTTMIISGAIAGIGGAIQITGVSYILYEGLSPGYGYTAVAVSLLANSNPLGVIISSFVFGVLRTGASAMQRVANVSSVIVSVIEGTIVILIVVSNNISFNNILNIFSSGEKCKIDYREGGL